MTSKERLFYNQVQQNVGKEYRELEIAKRFNPFANVSDRHIVQKINNLNAIVELKDAVFEADEKVTIATNALLENQEEVETQFENNAKVLSQHNWIPLYLRNDAIIRDAMLIKQHDILETKYNEVEQKFNTHVASAKRHEASNNIFGKLVNKYHAWRASSYLEKKDELYLKLETNKANGFEQAKANITNLKEVAANTGDEFSNNVNTLIKESTNSSIFRQSNHDFVSMKCKVSNVSQDLINKSNFYVEGAVQTTNTLSENLRNATNEFNDASHLFIENYKIAVSEQLIQKTSVEISTNTQNIIQNATQLTNQTQSEAQTLTRTN